MNNVPMRMRIYKKSHTRFAIGVVAALVVAGGILMLNKTDRSGMSDRSDRTVFSSSISPIISLGISVAEAQALPQGIALIESHIAIFGPRNERMNERVDLELKAQDNGEYGLVVNKKDTHAFTPGKYTVSADIETKQGIRHITQDFLWGVLAINPNKSIYQPGETAKLALAVLDERGMMVCDASLRLELKAQSSKLKTKEDILSTENGRIRVNPECYQKKVTQRPDYETEYTVQGPGIYQMTLTATTKNGTYTIEDFFEVREVALRQAQGDKFFDIERITATRIYPVHEYPVTIKVTPEEDFKGTVTETVPESFGVRVDDSNTTNKTYTSYRSYMSDKNDRIIAWTVDWKANQTYELIYTYKSPEISPQFYLLGPLRLYRSDPGSTAAHAADYGAGTADKADTTYTEARQWQIAVDAVVFSDTFTEASATLLSSHTPDTGSGWTQLIETGTCDLYIEVSADWLSAIQSVTSGGCGNSEGSLYQTTDAIVSADYDVDAILRDGGSGDDVLVTACRIQDANNMYAVRFNTSSSDLYKRTGGTWSTIDTTGGAIAANSVVTLRCTGTTISVLDDGVEILSATDTDHSAAGKAGIGLGAIMVSTDDVTALVEYGLDNFEVDTLVANSPTITSVTDSPDPSTALRSTVSFSTDWNDADGGETIKVKICKTNSLTSQNCDGGYWATSSSFTTTDPEAPTYGVEGSAVGSQSYYAFVCDDNGNCSSSTSGTFTVNPTTVPNVKFR